MGDTDKLEHYTPQHPLPEGVRKMERDETVCKYCGVSYLIHNEIKALEDKLKKVQEELEHYKGSEAREEVLKAQLVTKDKDIEELNKTIQGKESVLGALKNELRSKDDEILKADNAKSEVENRLKQMEETLSRSSEKLEKYKLKHGFLMANIPSVLSGVKQLRSNLLSIKTDQNLQHAIFKQSRQEILSTVSTVCSKHQSDFRELKEKMLELDNERISFKFKEEKYIQDIATMEAECHKIRSQGSSEQNQQQRKFDQLWNEYSALQSEFNVLREQIKVKDIEAVQYKDQINTHLQNLENMQGQMSQREMAMEQATIKQQKDLKKKKVPTATLR